MQWWYRMNKEPEASPLLVNTSSQIDPSEADECHPSLLPSLPGKETCLQQCHHFSEDLPDRGREFRHVILPSSSDFVSICSRCSCCKQISLFSYSQDSGLLPIWSEIQNMLFGSLYETILSQRVGLVFFFFLHFGKKNSHFHIKLWIWFLWFLIDSFTCIYRNHQSTLKKKKEVIKLNQHYKNRLTSCYRQKPSIDAKISGQIYGTQEISIGLK